MGHQVVHSTQRGLDPQAWAFSALCLVMAAVAAANRAPLEAAVLLVGVLLHAVAAVTRRGQHQPPLVDHSPF